MIELYLDTDFSENECDPDHQIYYEDPRLCSTPDIEFPSVTGNLGLHCSTLDEIPIRQQDMPVLPETESVAEPTTESRTITPPSTEEFEAPEDFYAVTSQSPFSSKIDLSSIIPKTEVTGGLDARARAQLGDRAGAILFDDEIISSSLPTEYFDDPYDRDLLMMGVVGEMANNLLEHGIREVGEEDYDLGVEIKEIGEGEESSLQISTVQPRKLSQSERENLQQVLERAREFRAAIDSSTQIGELEDSLSAIEEASDSDMEEAGKKGRLGFGMLVGAEETFGGKFEIRFDDEGHPSMVFTIPRKKK